MQNYVNLIYCFSATFQIYLPVYFRICNKQEEIFYLALQKYYKNQMDIWNPYPFLCLLLSYLQLLKETVQAMALVRFSLQPF